MYNQPTHVYQIVLKHLRRHGLLRPITLLALVLFVLFFFYQLLGLGPEEAQHEYHHVFEQPQPRPMPYDDHPNDWNASAVLVKNAFLHAYHGYERYASPHDELLPKSRQPRDPFNGWGVSVFDSLDTMLMMGLDDEFERAMVIVKATKFDLAPGKFAPFFETVIRYLGGLLSAYAITRKPLFLERAEELAHKLDPVFDAWDSGLPTFSVNPTDGKLVGPQVGTLAEIGSFQLEYTYLAKQTMNKHYFDRVNKVLNAVATANLTATNGMAPLSWDLAKAQPRYQEGYHLSVGGQADSMHEYLLKNYLLATKADKTSLELYIRTTTQILTKMLYVSPNRELLYVTDIQVQPGHEDKPSHIFEHLSCFLPGMLALGAHTVPLDAIDLDPSKSNNIFSKSDAGFTAAHAKLSAFGSLKDLHLWAAEGLAQTCSVLYSDQPTGLGPEEVLFKEKGAREPELWIDALAKWSKRGKATKPPGVGDKKPVVYTEAQRQKVGMVGRDYVVRKPSYLLRPETIESLYVMWRVTADPKWRTKGWNIFRAIERETKTAVGYASVRSVERTPAALDDDMPSYFLAETLKYLYLLFLEGKDPYPLDRWVFNTEAHPLLVYEWTDADRVFFGLPSVRG